MKKMLAAAAAVLALSACGGGEDKQTGLTAEDNRELNNAAEMLDTSPDSLVVADNEAVGNGVDEDAVGEETSANDSAANSE
jgi:hypothetical protein